jgi:type VI secretion system VasD/TssJ family lipoprotein
MVIMQRLRAWNGWVLLMAAGFMLSCLSCSGKPDPVPTWGYEPAGIRLTYTADRMLNSVEGRAHTVLLTVYQLTDPNAFQKLARYEEGIRRLLEGQQTDPTFTALKKIFVEPGESKTVALDRTESTKWLGLVAGYYSLDPAKVSRVFEIPYTVQTEGFISRTRVAKVPPLHVDLVLGPESLQVQEKKAK